MTFTQVINIREKTIRSYLEYGSPESCFSHLPLRALMYRSPMRSNKYLSSLIILVEVVSLMFLQKLQELVKIFDSK